MAGLFHSLNVGSEALFSSRQGIDTSGHNIASAQVEGFSRQRINLTTRHPLEEKGFLLGNGAYVESITRSHDQFIEAQLNKAQTQFGAGDSYLEGIKSLENVFSPELSASVNEEMTRFFNSLQDMASFPEELPVRTGVRESAYNLVSSFKRVDGTLEQTRKDFDDKIAAQTKDISDVLENISQLNLKIQDSESAPGVNANDLQDQRDKLLRELSEKIDVRSYNDKHGMLVVRGPGDTLLVEKGFSAKLDVARSERNDQMSEVVVTDFMGRNPRVITDKVSGGALKGTIDLRDKITPFLLKKNNEMAAHLITKFNEIHREGYGIRGFSELTGRNFFKEPADLSRAAKDIEVSETIQESTDAISGASTPLAPGNNVILNKLLGLKDQKGMMNNTSTLHEFYSDYVGVLGLDVQRAQHSHDANKILIQDLKARREAVSGVSLDEEAANLMKWQASFRAASKVITTVDELLETVINLKR